MSKAKKITAKDRVLAFIKSSRKKDLTYGEVAVGALRNKRAAMAVGQIMKSLAENGHKALARRVKSKKESAA